jgi:hypothetical protein
MIAVVSPAFGVFWNVSVHASKAGWPEVHVTLNREDSDGRVLIWSGERAATNEKEHQLDALVNVTMKLYIAALTPEKPAVSTRVSAPGFLGWGSRDRSTPVRGATVGAGEPAYGRIVCATSSSVLATSSTT